MNKEVKLKVKRLAIVSIISGIFVITLLFMYFCKTNVLNNLIGFALVVLFLGIAIISVNEIGTIISEERLKEIYIVTLREVLSNEFKEVKINKTNAVLKTNAILNYIFGTEIRYFLKIDNDDNITLKITDKDSNEEIYQKHITDYANIINLFEL